MIMTKHEADDFTREEEGWRGRFTRAQAPGAIPNGTRVVKAHDEDNDSHKMGDEATVLGSIMVPPVVYPQLASVSALTRLALARGEVLYGYFVEWDDMPKCAVWVSSPKIARKQ